MTLETEQPNLAFLVVYVKSDLIYKPSMQAVMT